MARVGRFTTCRAFRFTARLFLDLLGPMRAVRSPRRDRPAIPGRLDLAVEAALAPGGRSLINFAPIRGLPARSRREEAGTCRPSPRHRRAKARFKRLLDRLPGFLGGHCPR